MTQQVPPGRVGPRVGHSKVVGHDVHHQGQPMFANRRHQLVPTRFAAEHLGYPAGVRPIVSMI
jgi:hypothetical protein